MWWHFWRKWRNYISCQLWLQVCEWGEIFIERVKMYETRCSKKWCELLFVTMRHYLSGKIFFFFFKFLSHAPVSKQSQDYCNHITLIICNWKQLKQLREDPCKKDLCSNGILPNSVSTPPPSSKRTLCGRYFSSKISKFFKTAILTLGLDILTITMVKHDF